MTERYCTVVSPGGRGCGVDGGLIHSRHFNKAGEVWDTPMPYRPDTGPRADDWLWDQLHRRDGGVSREEFNRLLRTYEAKLHQQRFVPVQSLGPSEPDSLLWVKRPCRCCGCTGGTVCFHGGDATGCAWQGPGR